VVFEAALFGPSESEPAQQARAAPEVPVQRSGRQRAVRGHQAALLSSQRWHSSPSTAGIGNSSAQAGHIGSSSATGSGTPASRARRMARRSVGVVAAQSPVSSPWSSAQRRHSEATGQAWQIGATAI
jgi:hypothetical protein